MKGKIPLPMFSKVPRIPAPTSPILFASVGLLPNSPRPCDAMKPQPSSCRFLAVGNLVLLVVRAPSRLFLGGGVEKLKGEKGRLTLMAEGRGSKPKGPEIASETLERLDVLESTPFPRPLVSITSGAAARGVITSFFGRGVHWSAPRISFSKPDKRPCRSSMSLTSASSVSVKDLCSVVAATLLLSFSSTPLSSKGGSLDVLKFSSSTGAKSRFICASSARIPLMVMRAVTILFLFQRPSSLSACITLESSRS
mmetsp:Transcript_14500/g.49517  ORF Transcript_14500/g.49517 Transcript_14500/m.49517 type:complete len:253 (-) Transcript_14500:1951-2709(-)